MMKKRDFEWFLRATLVGVGAGLFADSFIATLGLILFGFGVAGGVSE